MITQQQTETEKKAYELWIQNRIKQQKHSLTMTLEAFTDRFKDVAHEYGRAMEGLSPETDKKLFELYEKFFEFEQFFVGHIETSKMARNHLNDRLDKELSDPAYCADGHLRRIL
jgi:aspartate aminotransferase-like enzyme